MNHAKTGEAEPRPKPPRWKTIRNWAIQLAVFTAVMFGIFAWQGRNLLGNHAVAPTFSAPTLSGTTVDTAALSGKKIVLYFFAPWCSVCHAASHNINAIASGTDPDEVAVFAVGLEYDDRSELEAFAAQQKLVVPVIAGNDQLRREYRVNSFPTIYIIDEQGRVEHQLVGYTTEIGLRLRLL